LTGVREYQNLASRRCDACIEGERFATGRDLENPDLCAESGQRLHGSIRRTVRDHDDLAAAGIVELQQVGDPGRQQSRLVTHRQDDGNGGPFACLIDRRFARRATGQPHQRGK
jgi:hypothetical protein